MIRASHPGRVGLAAVVLVVLAALLSPVAAGAQPSSGNDPGQNGGTVTARPQRVSTPTAGATVPRGPIDAEGFAAALGDPSDADALHVRLVAGTSVRVVDERLAGLPADVEARVDRLLRDADATVVPLFSRPRILLGLERVAATRRTGVEQTDLTLWVRVRIGDPSGARALMDGLNALDEVEVALPEPHIAPASMGGVAALAAMNVSPDFEVNQLYLDPAPGGVDADYAAGVPGGTGANVVVTDVEYSWNQAHEDLVGATTLIPNGTPLDPFDSTAHGTASIGVVGSQDNGFGVTGIAPDAPLQLVNVHREPGDQALTDAINIAAANSAPGDVILLEQQMCPVTIDVFGDCGPGWLPVEWYPSYYDAIVAAVHAGVHVVEAGGNGARNVDNQLFFPDSGAILVGAGNAPGCTAFGAEPPRGRLWFSNFGRRIDVQGHGGCVWSTGQEGGGTSPNKNISYTDAFSGTSSASAIVAGVVASLASVAEANADPLAPNELRALIRATGVAQDTSVDGRKIGPQPDLRAAIDSYLADPHPAPGNDDFQAPAPVTVPMLLAQDTDGASVQVGEPLSFCGFADTTVWYAFTAVADGRVRVRSTAPGANPSVALWWQAAPQAVSELDCVPRGRPSASAFVSGTVYAGETYLIQVGGTRGRTVNLELYTGPDCDVDGDGIEDVVIGAPDQAVKGKAGAGAVNVFYGHLRGLSDVAPQLTQASPGVAGAPRPGDAFGSAIACGDIDADGYDDVVVGIPGDTRGPAAASGAIQVFYGGPAGVGGTRDRLVHQATGGIPSGPRANERFGSAVAMGDVNFDGFVDVVVAAEGERVRGKAGAGRVTVIYGGFAGLDVSGGTLIHQALPSIPNSAQPGDGFGSALAVGDFDRDGKGDIVIGIAGEDLAGTTDLGAITVVPGSASGPRLGQSFLLSPTRAKVSVPVRPGLAYGSALTVGDLDGDGFVDLAVGAPGTPALVAADVAGGVVDLLRGGAGGLGGAVSTVLRSGVGGVAGSPAVGDGFGTSLAIADTDLAGLPGLYVGAPGRAPQAAPGLDDAGTVTEIRLNGSLVVLTSDELSQADPTIASAAGTGKRFGAALSAADVDLDGYPDVIVGVPGHTRAGRAGAGQVAIVPGSSLGLDTANDTAFHKGSAGIGGPLKAGAHFGAALS